MSESGGSRLIAVPSTLRRGPPGADSVYVKPQAMGLLAIAALLTVAGSACGLLWRTSPAPPIVRSPGQPAVFEDVFVPPDALGLGAWRASRWEPATLLEEDLPDVCDGIARARAVAADARGPALEVVGRRYQALGPKPTDVNTEVFMTVSRFADEGAARAALASIKAAESWDMAEPCYIELYREDARVFADVKAVGNNWATEADPDAFLLAFDLDDGSSRSFDDPYFHVQDRAWVSRDVLVEMQVRGSKGIDGQQLRYETARRIEAILGNPEMTVAELETLRAEPGLYLQPIGEVPERPLRELAAWYRDHWGVEVRILAPTPSMRAAWSDDREQYEANHMLEGIEELDPGRALFPLAIVVGITFDDIYTEDRLDWPFFFATNGDSIGLVSGARLGVCPGDTASTVTWSRIRKLVTRRFGLMYFDFEPSSDPTSPLYDRAFSTAALDRMGDDWDSGDENGPAFAGPLVCPKTEPGGSRAQRPGPSPLQIYGMTATPSTSMSNPGWASPATRTAVPAGPGSARYSMRTRVIFSQNPIASDSSPSNT